jgi:hypothetical protein
LTSKHAAAEERTSSEWQQRRCIDDIRRFLAGNADRITLPEALEKGFAPDISQVYVTLFQEGRTPLRWGARRGTLHESVTHVLKRLQSRIGFETFEIGDAAACRIMVEMVTQSRPCAISTLTTEHFTADRFEPGVTGVRCAYAGKTVYFMPTDAVTQSVMSVSQLLNALSKKIGIAKQTPKVSERVKMMRSLPLDCALIRSIAFVSYGEGALALFRGLPVPQEFSVRRIETALRNSIKWLADNMKADGRFLYYYDPLKDSEVDFQHLNMTDPTYYNILRHSGGTIALLMGFERFGDPALLEAARRSADYFVTTLREHDADGETACYPFYNGKSKLGGAGMGLVSIMHYERLTGDRRYRQYAQGLARHLLSRIEPDGEMIGYYIHPLFRAGAPLTEVSAEEKGELFSFYYPGEALLGLALFYRDIEEIPEALKAELLVKSRQALDFLVLVRPTKYKELFEPLPADSWLMQAVETWDTIAGIVTDDHRAFVYGDAEKMMNHMYVPKNAPYADYTGGFFYRYGDHVYHDGSRCEGLMAAYHLAKGRGERRKASKILNHMLLSARGLLRTYNSPESTYAHRFPKRTVGSFRFKLTRQWVRVDSVQHTACFLARLYPLLKGAGHENMP